jgi:hypothetical protein
MLTHQFRVAQWDIACLARINPTEYPPSTRMALPKGRTDRRRIMSTVYSLYRGDGASERDLAEAGHSGRCVDESTTCFKRFATSLLLVSTHCSTCVASSNAHSCIFSISDEFYSLFYLGLYCEIRNETAKAEKYMRAAASSKYATGSGNGDYMTSCARVHCKLRGWV